MANKRTEEIKTEEVKEEVVHAEGIPSYDEPDALNDKKEAAFDEAARIAAVFEQKKAEFDSYVAGVLAGASAKAGGAESAHAEETHVAVPDTYSGPEWEKTVSVTLFKDNGKYKDDLFVGVNGKRFQIQRGVPVLIPKAVYEVIENSQIQDVKAAEWIGRLTSKAKEL